MDFELKTVAGKRILYVMAVDAEYGVHLRSHIDPLMTGVGPVEAAVVLTAALARLDASGHRPDLIVSLGSAGSARLEQTEVYQASSVSYRDMDASALGFEKGLTPFLDLPKEVALPLQVAGIPSARLSTGANIVSGAAYDAIDADMVEMETYAVLRAAQHFGIPLIGLRGISDGKDELKHVGNWTEYLHVIDEKLAKAVRTIEEALDNGSLML